MPTAQADPAGARSIVAMIFSVEPIWSAASTTSCWHSGWTITLTPGIRRADLGRHCRRVNRPCTEQWPSTRSSWLGERVRVDAAVGPARVPDHAVVQAQAKLEHGGVPAQVLVGQEQHLRSPLAASAQSSARLALDDVQTVPPCRPVNALMSAEEFM